MLQELNEKNFDDNISTGKKLVEFFSPTCGYCKMQRPVLEELSKSGLWIGTVDFEQSPALVQLYNVTAFPSFILFENGEIMHRFQGLQSKYDIMNILKDFV